MLTMARATAVKIKIGLRTTSADRATKKSKEGFIKFLYIKHELLLFVKSFSEGEVMISAGQILIFWIVLTSQVVLVNPQQ